MAHLFQDSKQKAKLGSKTAWYVGWTDLAGKQRKKKVGPKSMAKKFAIKVESDMIAGLCGENRMTFKKFREKFEATVLPLKRPASRDAYGKALDSFERHCKPKRLETITTETIDEFKVKRLRDRGCKRGSTVASATVNRDLRHIRAALRKAHRWGHLARVPEFELLPESQKLVQYVTGEHFALIYQHCNVATKPRGLPYDAPEWWRTFTLFQYMTGWRVNEPLSLLWEDIDLAAGTAITRAEDNKGNREEQIRLHPLVVEHLETIKSFHVEVFPWFNSPSTLWNQFHRIQRAAGVHLTCRGMHEHTPKCHVYGFHDLRRAFATMNASRLSADSLQALMRHKDYATTKRYINMARRLDDDVQKLHVPTLPVLRSS